MTPLELQLSPPEGASQDEVRRIMQVIDDAQRSRKGSREALRKLFADYPELTKVGADVVALAEGAILNIFAKTNVFLEESQRQKLAAMRKELEKSEDTELERLLVGRAVTCWLGVYCAELVRGIKWESGVTRDWGDFWDRHVSTLNADFLKACKTLALVRRLMRPSIAQINIAEQQVNVAAAGAERPADLAIGETPSN